MTMTWIYQTNEDDTARFVLGNESDKPLLCFGVNPSTAEPEKLDPTIESVERITLANQYSSWIMLNLYPQRATNPDNMHETRSVPLHQQNLHHIEEIFKKNPRVKIWAAWGDLIEKRSYLIDSLIDIIALSEQYGCSWIAINDKTKKGNPRHPLFQKYNENLITFHIDEYLENLK